MNKQQWQEDVKQFGELAYLMWEAGIKTHHDKTSYLSCLNNFSVEMLINAKSDIRRKQSAALPFDLAAAEAGDGIRFKMTAQPLQLNLDYFDCETKDIPNEIWGNVFCRIIKMYGKLFPDRDIYINSYPMHYQSQLDGYFQGLKCEAKGITNHGHYRYDTVSAEVREWLNRDQSKDGYFTEHFKDFLTERGGRHFSHVDGDTRTLTV